MTKLGKIKLAKRHALSTRLWHWVNAISVIILFMSGLTISNAHRRLYWGDWGFDSSQAWFVAPMFPGWATIPTRYSLAIARDYHVLFALVFGFSLLAFMLIALFNGHIYRDLFARAREWSPAHIWLDIREHLKFNFDPVEGKYNILQKISYSGVVFVLLPLMVFTGMAMSPGQEAAWPWLSEMFGGRQSARSIHFICAFALVGFLIVHVLLVLVSGPIKQLRDMITGGRAE
ncbi:cytochrome b/b6 domain-containing protein [Aurantiacibacter flavus]|uniref:Cytochrome b/b6 domain-containing protein n=1 Tax=Aurantiacibacter flavus TaxID=3145232 RepID=A0ABV0CW73_9SPHN